MTCACWPPIPPCPDVGAGHEVVRRAAANPGGGDEEVRRGHRGGWHPCVPGWQCMLLLGMAECSTARCSQRRRCQASLPPPASNPSNLHPLLALHLFTQVRRPPQRPAAARPAAPCAPHQDAGPGPGRRAGALRLDARAVRPRCQGWLVCIGQHSRQAGKHMWTCITQAAGWTAVTCRFAKHTVLLPC